MKTEWHDIAITKPPTAGYYAVYDAKTRVVRSGRWMPNWMPNVGRFNLADQPTHWINLPIPGKP